ncbi:MAG: cytochrome-c peroxidase [Burkholderiales bacterium PBB4]|nr:MAG: cytochrome-c peroxidase [Burkholderiales bacterium PBB4]
MNMALKRSLCMVLWACLSCGLAALSGCGGASSGADSTAAAPANTALPTGAATGQAVAPAPAALSARARLGQLIFTDTDLSEPRGTACVACHQANQGFAGNHGSRIGVALGSTPGALGLRNAMTNSYSGLIPSLSFVTTDGDTEAIGGHFWDGRADTLAQQALGPLLNPLEMNNPSRQAVIAKIAASSYAPLFRAEFGANVFTDTDAAFNQIGVAIEAFERAALQPFSSKYDAFVRGTATLSASESRGMALFQDPNRANCAGCHLMNPASKKPEDSLFSEFSYYATGIPRNTSIPRNANPGFYDLGLCGPERTAPALPATVPSGTTIDRFCGKFRMPTLRNVAERPALMHNGFFNNLSDVVRFYSTRNSNPQRWYGPTGVPNDLPLQYLGNLETTKAPFNRTAAQGPVLNDTEIADLVAFLRTLSDGFQAQ